MRTLVAVANHKSITRAADAVHLSVPAVSAHIANLEAQFASELLDRRRKPARLTAAGRQLAERCRELLQQHEQLVEDFKRPGTLSGRIAVGASPTVLTEIIPRALVRLRESSPLLKIQMIYSRPWTMLEMVSRHELDVAIIGEPRSYTPNVAWTPFAKEAIVVIAPPHAKGTTDEKLLREFPYIRYSRYLWVSREIEEHLARRNIVLNTEIEVDSREAIEVMVRHGLGVSIIPQSNEATACYFGLKSLPLGTPPTLRPIGLARRDNNPKQSLIDALLDMLRRSVAEHGTLV